MMADLAAPAQPADEVTVKTRAYTAIIRPSWGGACTAQSAHRDGTSSFSSSGKPFHGLHTFVTCCWLLRGPLIQGRGGNVWNDLVSNMA